MAVKIFGFISFLLFAVNCSTTDPPPTKETITITLEDISSTEAWFKMTTTNLQLPTSITLKQNDTARATINLISADSLLYIDSLLPNTNYQYQASSIRYRVTK